MSVCVWCSFVNELGMCGNILGYIDMFQYVLGAQWCSGVCLRAHSMRDPVWLETNQPIRHNIKRQDFLSWRFQDIKISKPPYVSFPKMVRFCYFLWFLHLLQRNYNWQSFWITLYKKRKEECHWRKQIPESFSCFRHSSSRLKHKTRRESILIIGNVEPRNTKARRGWNMKHETQGMGDTYSWKCFVKTCSTFCIYHPQYIIGIISVNSWLYTGSTRL